MLESLQSILDESWKPVSRPALAAWLIFYVGFLAYAFSAHGGFLFIDSANLVVHEGGHNLFGWFGPTLGLWGGTLLQWLVPFLLAAYFFASARPAGFVFCLFFFFENWLYTATYMAEPREIKHCLWSRPAIPISSSTIGTQSSPASAFSTTTRRLPSPWPSAGLVRNDGVRSVAVRQKQDGCIEPRFSTRRFSAIKRSGATSLHR